jgi:hypothetical protein
MTFSSDLEEPMRKLASDDITARIMKHPIWGMIADNLDSAVREAGPTPRRVRQMPRVSTDGVVMHLDWGYSYQIRKDIIDVWWHPSESVQKQVFQDLNLQGQVRKERPHSPQGGGLDLFEESPEAMAFLEELRDAIEGMGLGFVQTTVDIGTDTTYIGFNSHFGNISLKWLRREHKPSDDADVGRGQLLSQMPEWVNVITKIDAAARRGGLRPFSLQKEPSIIGDVVYDFGFMRSYTGDFGHVMVRWDPSTSFKRSFLDSSGLRGDTTPRDWPLGKGAQGTHPRDYPTRMKFLMKLRDIFESTGLGFNQDLLTVEPHQVYIIFTGREGSLSVQWNWKKASEEYFVPRG